MQAIQDNHQRGVDLSNHQGNVDFDKVQNWFRTNRGMDPWVEAKASQGNYYLDPFLKQYYEACKQRGIKIGAYHFADWGNVQEEIAQFLKAIDGMTFEAPVVLDAERSGNLPDESWTKQKATDWMVTFLEAVKATGRRVAVYASTAFINQYFDERMKAYYIWVADYNPQFQPGQDSIYDRWQAYQYTSSGQIDGIQGNVDLNVCEPEWLQAPVEATPAQDDYAMELAVAVQQFGFLDSPDYWAEVMRGNAVADHHYVQLLFEKICKIMWAK